MSSGPRGLTSGEAVARLHQFGPNEVAPTDRWAGVRQLGRYLVSPLVLILLLASGLSAAFGQFASATITAAMVVLSVVLDFAQSYRSQAAARRLRESVGQTATVLRDGASRFTVRAVGRPSISTDLPTSSRDSPPWWQMSRSCWSLRSILCWPMPQAAGHSMSGDARRRTPPRLSGP